MNFHPQGSSPYFSPVALYGGGAGILSHRTVRAVPLGMPSASLEHTLFSYSVVPSPCKCAFFAFARSSVSSSPMHRDRSSSRTGVLPQVIPAPSLFVCGEPSIFFFFFFTSFYLASFFFERDLEGRRYQFNSLALRTGAFCRSLLPF